MYGMYHSVKWLLILFLGLIVIPVFAQNTPNNQTDVQKFNDSIKILQSEHVASDRLAFFYAMATFVGGAGIAIVIGLGQKRQTQTIEKMTREVQDVVKKQNKLIDDTRDVYASAYVSWVHHITFSFDHVINLYNNRYLGQPISQNRENTRSTIKDHYDRDLTISRPKVETLELVKVFGKEIADKVWTYTAHLQANEWQPYSDDGMALLINDYKKYVKKAVDLKDTFLPFCDENMQKKDQKHRETYNKIRIAYPETEPENNSIQNEVIVIDGITIYPDGTRVDSHGTIL